MDIRAFKATALGRAASGYVQQRLAQLPVVQALDFLWFQALASVSALRNANDPPAVWRHFAFKDSVTAWGEHYNAIHPGINMFSVHFANRAPWCQHVIGQSRRIETNLPDGTEVSLALRLHDGAVKYIKGFAFEARASAPSRPEAPRQAYVRRVLVSSATTRTP